MGTWKKILLVVLIAALITGGYFAGKYNGKNEVNKEVSFLRELNRSSISNMSVEKGETIYVIGHHSPDTDTVSSAILYARLLNEMGYKAEAVITEPVNHETEFILQQAGVAVPPVLENAAGKNIVLVDHSEYLQAADGMPEAHIVAVIDHHGVGSVMTGHQLVYDARPIGSTATLIWIEYLNYGLEIDKTTAFLMLGAILSDTDNLTGTSTIEADRMAVEKLSVLADVQDVNALYRKIHEAKLSYEGMSSIDILFSDYKEYEAYGIVFGIGLVNAIDEEAAAALSARLKEVLPEGYAAKDVDLLYAAVTIRENGEKIDYIVPLSGLSEKVFKDAFPNYDEYDGTSYIFRSGLGRKTKLVPGLTDYLAKNTYQQEEQGE